MSMMVLIVKNDLRLWNYPNVQSPLLLQSPSLVMHTHSLCLVSLKGLYIGN
jgi:hypothetical protein